MRRNFNINDYHIPRSAVLLIADEYCHNEKYKSIWIYCVLDGNTYEEAAEEFGFSRNQISNIVTSVTRLLSPYICNYKNVIEEISSIHKLSE